MFQGETLAKVADTNALLL